MELLNCEQVKTLFEREAVLFGTADGIPIQKVEKLFGQKAADFAARLNHGSNGFGIGDYTAYYLTFRGFQTAATYHNVDLIRSLV